jgi:hypothetical protein
VHSAIGSASGDMSLPVLACLPQSYTLSPISAILRGAKMLLDWYSLCDAGFFLRLRHEPDLGFRADSLVSGSCMPCLSQGFHTAPQSSLVTGMQDFAKLIADHMVHVILAV